MEELKVGVYVRHCGPDIAGTVNSELVAEAMQAGQE